jgi:hypothetical protein
MSTTPHVTKALLIVAAGLAASLAACEKKEEPSATEPAKSAAPAPTPTPTPEPAKPPEPEVKHDCPEGSEGVGSFEKPCEAKGADRMMEVTWNGKLDDAGPSFRVVSTSKLVILYGKLAVYFYDKAGKQLEVPGGTPEKPKMHQDCFGNIFGGVMKAGEKAVMTFSCVKKSHVPEGTAAIEAEVRMVGFTDEAGKKSTFYWKNDDLAPDTRPKGGIKADAKKKKKG